MKSVLPALAVAGLLVAAPVASADDAGLFTAYNARQGEVDAAGAAYLRAVKRARRSGSRAAYRGVIRADRRINRVLTAIEGDLAAQTGSSEHGRNARVAGLREIRLWRRANTIEIREIRALMRGEEQRAARLLKQANRTMRRCFRQGRIAVREFKAVGLTSPQGSIS